ncbi:caspase-6 [Silurus asotus]|uniref:Caspase-6 n=1 Tax=Silurus asotus TaxID=30991 RepID=A0AAD5FQ45_SILAS|nr:caspase-6 [Silurus asotus]
MESSESISMFNIKIPAITNCCNEHDHCYDTCGQEKRDCDEQFQICLKNICRNLLNVLGLDQKVQACESGLNLVFDVVMHLGCKPYLESQRAAYPIQPVTVNFTIYKITQTDYRSRTLAAGEHQSEGECDFRDFTHGMVVSETTDLRLNTCKQNNKGIKIAPGQSSNQKFKQSSNQKPRQNRDQKQEEGSGDGRTETDAFYRSSRAMDPNEEYNMNHKRRGLALIFNQENFYWHLRLNSRNGTNADRDNLKRRFEQLEFEVRVYDDKKRDDILRIITEASKANHVDADCFVCMFLSHGENGHVYAYDDQINIQDMTSLFRGDKCPSLVGKPKIFILQACRGDKHDDPVTPMDVVDSKEVNQMVVDAGVVQTLPAGADFIMCYSVAEGFYSHRETVNGSWFIQDLCELLHQYGFKLEFTELLTLVNRRVAQRSVERCKEPSAFGKKQVPCFASMLTKKLYFRSRRGDYV